ncbi:uncharacterized protein HMPREF1541_09820 [Cyphellophora europaea CBS 101466]|uniref:Uncharacterized protein n=1 Tax=Cyphellophora europaea (strain CBS 101466) TaxID=1220924 RepID=W2S8J5_CYPE1|nr:uncharacterized protein HMPREF1541_09820 [Cyphellophora europaea CBS 101466]ETN44945.1 hypothetical protein HMPREF1541_09820 [Cyphellophora europaea CBS 101466]
MASVEDKIEPIAVVGLSCRFPGDASNPSGLWDMMSESRNGHSKIPADRFNADTWYHPSHDRRGAVNVKHGFFLKEDVSLFDAPFFSITAKEASGMDPMQRCLLEVSYETFENAGVPVDQLIGSKTSVFCGCFTGDYDLLSNHDIFDHAPNAATGTGRAMLSNRVSWFFDLRGASFTVDTACSSSLYALHSACQSLRLGESSQALVTGSNLALYPSMMHSLTNMHFLSPDGKCHSFDDRANGYARGEAIGGILLKPLKEALKDGDTIRGVIRGSGANQDGKTPGITQPSPESQADLIRFTYDQAGLNMNETGYFEAHGTGTALGDPMELSAIGQTFGRVRSSEQPPLYVGSIKTNIGHTEGCSGLAGVIKSILCLEKGLIPPNSGFQNLNPKLRLQEWKLALPMELTPWPSSGLRRISVNSFGYGGANAHVIIDDAHHYLKSRGLQGNHTTAVSDDDASDSGVSLGDCSSPSEDGQEPSGPEQKLFTFSAHDQAGIARNAVAFRDFTQHKADLATKETAAESAAYLDDLAYTLANRRTKFDYRSFAVADSMSSLAASLTKGLPKLKRVSKDQNVIFVCTGQGAQWPQMGKQLLSNPIFRAATAKSQAYLEQYGCTWNVFEELARDGIESKIDSPEFSQPICSVLQISLIELLKHWGLQPKATVGHSSGEIAAAYAAGYLSHEDAIKAAYWRGVYSADVANRIGDRKGVMMAAGVGEAEAQELLREVTKGTAVVACINSPSSVTLSGDVPAIVELEELLKARGKFARQLRVKTAYHSPHMQVIADDYLNAMGEIAPLPGNGAIMFSSVTGKIASASDFSASYWVQNMVGSVRFNDAVSGLISHSQGKGRRKLPVKWSTVVEVGPHEALKGPVNQIVAAVDSKLSSTLGYTAPILRGKDASVTALEAAGQLWASGHALDLSKVNQQDGQLTKAKALSDLPPYAWNHGKSFWYEPRMTTAKRFRTQPRTDLLGVPIDNQNNLEPHWRNILRVAENPWMAHHEITGTTLYPGAGMLIMAIEAARQLADPERILKGIELHDVTFGRGLVIPSGEDAVETSLSLRPNKTFPACYDWTLYSLPTGSNDWIENSSGRVGLVYTEGQEVTETEWQHQSATYKNIKAASDTTVNIEKFYTDLAGIGMNYGPLFRNLVAASAAPDTNQAHGSVTIPDTKSVMPHNFEYPHLIHPATLDAIFHLLFIGFTAGEPMKEAAVPVKMEKMFIAATCPQGAGSKYVGYTQGTLIDGRDLAGDLVLSDEEWSEPKVVISISAREVSSHDEKASASDAAIEAKRSAKPVWKEDFKFMDATSVARCIQTEARTAFPQLYQEISSQVAFVLDRACHKDADLRALFVVDHTSADLRMILENFAPNGDQRQRFHHCAVAAQKTEVLDELKAELGQSGLSIDYKVFDLATPLTEQDFKLDSYNLVVAAGDNVTETTPAVVPLLSPAGELLFTGPNSRDTFTGFDGWEKTLDCNALEVRCRVDSDKAVLVLAEKQTQAESKSEVEEIVLLRRSDASEQLLDALRTISEVFTARKLGVKIATLEEAASFKGNGVISFLEAESPFVVDWKSEHLEAFKEIVASSPYLLWITKGGQIVTPDSLNFAVATGMLRTVRTEVPQITLPHLDISPGASLMDQAIIDLLVKVFETTVSESETPPDMEYAESDGKVLVCRVVDDAGMDRELELQSGNPPPELAALFQQGKPVQLSSNGEWVNDETALTDLADTEVEIQSYATALTSSDLVARAKGQMMGHDSVGEVIRVGSQVTTLQPGQQVALVKNGTYKIRVRQDQSLVRPVPSRLSPVQVAGLSTTYATALYALSNCARIRSSDRILVTSAHTNMGAAVAQLASSFGAQVYAVTEDGTSSILQERGIPESRIINARTDWAPRLARESGSFDIVITAGETANIFPVCSLVSDFGRIVDTSSSVVVEQLDSRIFKRNASFAAVEVDHLLRAEPSLLSDLLTQVFAKLEAGTITPLPQEIFSISQLSEAIESAGSNSSPSTTVLTFDHDALVPMRPAPPAPMALDPSATYVLSGGLGGLGANIAETMFQAGARHLVFLSRSGATTPAHLALLAHFESRGCKAEAIKCDITQESQMRHLRDTAASRGWKIKGCLQLAMVLRDSVLENMTYDKWQGATACKIQGTWNLHAYLPADLDFFVCLSSVVSVIGNTGQANYAAGNSYMDALCHVRRLQGLNATSLNIGLVNDATHFTADFTVEDFLSLYAHLVPVQVADWEVNAAILAAMKGFTAPTSATATGAKVPAQVVVGIRGDLDREGSVTSLWPKDRKFDHRAIAGQGAGGDGKVKLATLLAGAAGAVDAAEVVEGLLRENVASSMGSSADSVDADKPLHTFGIDSLKAVEVRNWLFREAKADVSVFDILSPVPLKKLAVMIVGKSKLVKEEVQRQAVEELRD